MIKNPNYPDASLKEVDAKRVPGIGRNIYTSSTSTTSSSTTSTTILELENAVVYMFHGFYTGAKPSGYRNTYYTDIDDFKEQIISMKDRGIQFITLSELAENIRNKESFKSSTVALTFDDALDEHYDIANFLSSNGIKGTFAVHTAMVGKPGKLTEEQIKEMSDAGHDIASHSHNHDLENKAGYLNRNTGESWNAWKQRVEYEIETPKTELSRITGKSTKSYIYVGGEHGSTVDERNFIEETLRTNGYKIAAVITNKIVDISTTNEIFTPRYTVGDVNIASLTNQVCNILVC